MFEFFSLAELNVMGAWFIIGFFYMLNQTEEQISGPPVWKFILKLFIVGGPFFLIFNLFAVSVIAAGCGIANFFKWLNEPKKER